MCRKNIVFSLLFFPLFLYGQMNAVTHGNFQEELALRKIYRDAQVVSCKIHSNEFEPDNPQLIREEEYDTEGKLIRRIEFQYNPEKEDNDSIITHFRYDNKGRLSGYTVENLDVEDISGGYSYNAKNELIYYGVASAEAREYTFTYKKGLLIHEIGNGAVQLKADGTPDWTKFEETFFEYNKQKQRIGEKFYFLGNLNYTKAFEYDNTGKLLVEKIWFGEKNGEPDNILTNIYDQRNLLIETKHHSQQFTETRNYRIGD